MQFDALLEVIQLKSEDHLVLLGDLVDRGPDSEGVIARVLSLQKTRGITCLMGNHEQMMLAARDSHDKRSDWIQNGGDETLKSYAGARGTLRDVPPEHWNFLETNLLDYLETDTHIFVHANAHPDMKMSEQPDYMLRWERCDEIQPHESGKIIVCGHTPQKSGRPMNRGFAICLDTNACRDGMLTALDVGSGKIWQVDSKGHTTRSHVTDYGE
jgi:serine/threonine protein phosphatase 1